MPRPKFQRGHVRLTGKREKKWTGFYYVHTADAAGVVTPRHRSVVLGTRAEIRTKHEAEERLQAVIERDTRQSSDPGVVRSDVTVAWFLKEVFVKLRQPRWKGPYTEANNVVSLEKHILPVIGNMRLEEVTPVVIQDMLNSKAAETVMVKKGGKWVNSGRTYSRSTLHRMYVLTKAMFQEAVEQDYIRKNPVRRCTPPPTREPSRPALTAQQVLALLGVLGQRDRLIVRLLSICALRAGELFGLRWADWKPFSGALQIRQQISGTLKTKASAAPVMLTSALENEIAEWCASADTWPCEAGLIFPSEADTPIAPGNWLKRVLRPAAKKAGIEHITLHMFRRTFPTLGQGEGSVKDLQTQLRHASPDMTAGVYMQAVDPSVRATAEAVERKINEAGK